jgi:mannosyltransferase
MSTETTAVPDAEAPAAARHPTSDRRRGRGLPALAVPALSPIEWAGLLLPMLGLTILALRELGDPSLWRDEVSSVIFAKGSLGDLLTIIGRDRAEVGLVNMATYYLILHFWLIVGETEARIRFLSVIFGVLSVVPVYFVARRLGGWVAGALAASIFALIPYVIHYSQEARGYSLAMLMAGAMTWLLLIGLDRRERVWPWLAYGLIGALGLYVHFFMALVVAGHGLWALGTRQIPPLRSIAAAAVPLALAAAPIPFVIAEFGGEHEWIPELTAARAYAGLEKLIGGSALILVMTALLAFGAYAWRRDRGFWLLVASLLVPIVGAMAISVVKPMFIPRYLIMVLPALAVVAGLAIVAMRPILLRSAAAVVVIGVLLVGLPSAYFSTTNIDWRAAGRWMADEVRPGDRVVMVSWKDSPLEYYFLRFDPPAIPTRLHERELPAADPGARIWLALMGGVSPREASEELEGYLGRYRVATARSYGPRAQLFLLEPLSGTAAAAGAASLLPSAGPSHGQEGR